VTAVEMAHTQQNFIISCCKQLGVRNLHLIRGDVFKFLKACHVQYDFIYADPPYDLEQLPTLPDLIFEQGVLKEGGYFVLEHSKHNDFYNHPHFVEQRSYGSVHFSFFQ
jgi:16S rRNA G966 N2-methylase RsmD